MTAATSPMIHSIDEALKTLRHRSLVPIDEVVDRLLDLRALAEMDQALRDVTETEQL